MSANQKITAGGAGMALVSAGRCAPAPQPANSRERGEEEQMKMTTSEHTQNAEDFVGMSQDLAADEKIDRDQLAEQFTNTEADSDDVEAIAIEIERICQERF